jgi:serine/threonine protein kinase
MAQSDGTSPFFDSLNPARSADDHGAANHPLQVGPYRILSVLGEGGMGTVYEAEQLEPVRRRVAVKLVKLGMDTRDVIARFEAERQALAMMNHPNIAQVFDAGAGTSGRPYFVMELVEGTPLTGYCDARLLPTNRRLELFAQVCDAVQHAHTKGIIHRDLKPGNVLVAEVDGRPVPKVIDFGIAKAIDQQAAERTLFTELGRMVGTPEYMSPEQAGKPSADVDTRTDVYSLGVMLYELLTGTLPFEAATLRALAYAEMQRIICEVEPMRPSTRIASVPPADAAPLAGRRRETVASLAGALRRELEWIPLKAMRKDRDHRYRTASELADDVRNYLTGRPLLAGPETRAYQAWKFVRRHRGAAAVAASLLTLLIGGVAASSWQAARATSAERVASREKADADVQRAAAQRRFNDVRALSSRMLFDLLPDIDRLAGSTPATRKLVDMSLEYLSNLQAEASGDVQLMQDVAAAYIRLGDVQGNPHGKNIGDVPGAAKSYQRATNLVQKALAVAPNDPKSVDLQGMAELKTGDILVRQGLRDQALPHYTAARSLYAQVQTMQPDGFRAASNILIADQRLAVNKTESGDFAGAVTALRENVRASKALAERFPSKEARDFVPTVLHLLASAQGRADQYADAVVTIREEVALLDAAFTQGQDDAGVQHDLGNALVALAYMLLSQLGDAAGAVEPLDRAVHLLQHAYDADPNDQASLAGVARALNMQKEAMVLLHRDAEAEQAVGRAIDLLRLGLRTAPSDRMIKQNLILAFGNRADLLEKRQDLAGALEARREAVRTLMPLVEADPNNMTLQPGLAYMRRQTADTLLALKDYAAAVDEARVSVAIGERLVARNANDIISARGLIVAQRTLLAALAGVVAAPTSTPEQRAAARVEGRQLAGQIRKGVDRLKERNGLPLSNIASVYTQLEQAERDFVDRSERGAATSRPGPTSRP